MASVAQVNANRLNAQSSTGPTTPEGVDACRFNATKHGLSGQQIVIKGEDPAQYDAARTALIHEYLPETEVEAMLVEQIAQSWWRLQRAARIDAKLTSELGEMAIYTDEKATKQYANFIRHRNAIERSWKHGIATLQKLQAERKVREEAEDRAMMASWAPPIPSYAATLGSVLQQLTGARRQAGPEERQSGHSRS